MTTTCADVMSSVLLAMVFSSQATLRTFCASVVELEEVLKASLVIRKLLLKIPVRELWLFHTRRLPLFILYVKG